MHLTRMLRVGVGAHCVSSDTVPQQGRNFLCGTWPGVDTVDPVPVEPYIYSTVCLIPLLAPRISEQNSTWRIVSESKDFITLNCEPLPKSSGGIRTTLFLNITPNN